MLRVLALASLVMMLANQAYSQEAIERPYPIARDLTGEYVTRLMSGHQVNLTSNIPINTNVTTPYVVILEIRDSSNVSTFLGWQKGTIESQGIVSYGMSWTPEHAGFYQLRHHVITNMDNAEVGEIMTTNVEVFS